MSKLDAALDDYFAELLSEASAVSKEGATPIGLDADVDPSADTQSSAAAMPPEVKDAKQDTTFFTRQTPLTKEKPLPKKHPVPTPQSSEPIESSKVLSAEAVPGLLDLQKQKLQALLSPTIPEETQTKHAVQAATETQTLEELQVATAAPESVKAHNSEPWTERPDWADEDFDALLFDVGGLTLAVPLVSLGQITPLSLDALTPLFGQSDWFMGMLLTNIGKLKVVNTALFVMPEKYSETFIHEAQYAVSLDGSDWALAVNSVNQPVRLKLDDIKWRTERSKRPWLAGTVKSAMCALLDVSTMGQIFLSEDRS